VSKVLIDQMIKFFHLSGGHGRQLIQNDCAMLKVTVVLFFALSQFQNRINAFQTIPFTLVGNLILISGTVDGKIGNFILDTGTPVVILNGKYFEGQKSDKVMQGISGEGGPVATRYSTIELGGNKWKSIYSEVFRLEALEAALGQPIHGLLGCQLFKKHIVEFDYKNLCIRLSSFEIEESIEDQGPSEMSSIPTYRYKGKIPVINVSIGSIILKLIIDTGSAYNILRKKDLGNLTSNTIKWDNQRLVGLGDDEVRVQAGTVFDLQVGEKICNPMKTLFSDDSRMQMLCPGQSVDGILGYEYLKQVTMTIDFRSNTVYFQNHSNAMKDEVAAQ
jgi:hypothetical protein